MVSMVWLFELSSTSHRFVIFFSFISFHIQDKTIRLDRFVFFKYIYKNHLILDLGVAPNFIFHVETVKFLSRFYNPLSIRRGLIHTSSSLFDEIQGVPKHMRRWVLLANRSERTEGPSIKTYFLKS